MGEKPSPLGGDFRLIVGVALRIQGKTWMVFSLDPLTLESVNP